MKNTSLMLTLSALLSFSALNASTIIEDAIKDSDLETLRIIVAVGTTHNHSFTVTKAAKEIYMDLARTKVEKCVEHCKHSNSFGALSTLDWLSITAYSALVGKGIIDVVDTTWRRTKEDKDCMTFVGLGAFLYGLGNLLRSYKDLAKSAIENRLKAREDLKKAEKVQKLVECMPVEA